MSAGDIGTSWSAAFVVGVITFSASLKCTVAVYTWLCWRRSSCCEKSGCHGQELNCIDYLIICNDTDMCVPQVLQAQLALSNSMEATFDFSSYHQGSDCHSIPSCHCCSESTRRCLYCLQVGYSEDGAHIIRSSRHRSAHRHLHFRMATNAAFMSDTAV